LGQNHTPSITRLTQTFISVVFRWLSFLGRAADIFSVSIGAATAAACETQEESQNQMKSDAPKQSRHSPMQPPFE
jgi:hypothetical protein